MVLPALNGRGYKEVGKMSNKGEMIPTNWKKISKERANYYKKSVYVGDGNIPRVGQDVGEPWECSYCHSKKIVYEGSVWIGGSCGSTFYISCEKCQRKLEPSREGGANPVKFIGVPAVHGKQTNPEGIIG